VLQQVFVHVAQPIEGHRLAVPHQQLRAVPSQVSHRSALATPKGGGSVVRVLAQRPVCVQPSEAPQRRWSQHGQARLPIRTIMNDRGNFWLSGGANLGDRCELAPHLLGCS
jgi:hypothetical protein